MEPDEAGALARHVREACAHLRLAGLMTIGQPDYSSRPENFQVSWVGNSSWLGPLVSWDFVIWGLACGPSAKPEAVQVGQWRALEMWRNLCRLSVPQRGGTV